MASMSSRAFLGFVAAGMAGCAAGVAMAQPRVVTISGATLFQNFFLAPASTNDFIDVDGDTVSGRTVSGVDQLAPLAPPVFPFPSSAYWAVQYRGVGSLNGFIELRDTGSTSAFATGGSTISLPLALQSVSTYNSRQFNSGTSLITSGSGAIGNAGNPGGFPVREDTSTLRATYNTPPTASTGGLRVDIAPADVPSFWIARIGGTPADVNVRPGVTGYGNNTRVSKGKAGTLTGGGQDVRLPSLGSLNLYNGVPANANSSTVFDTGVAAVPVAFYVNFGVGRETATMSELRHLLITGRMLNGENLTIVTRDVGSGTHNVACNTLGLDPSFCNGENIGLETTDNNLNNLGPAYQPGNKGGSGQMENTILNTRLAIGYSGAERGVNNGLLAANRMDLLGIVNDIYGGSTPVRPFIDNILDNSAANGYLVFGNETFLTIGDPLGEPVNLGGTNAGTPRMANTAAAAYVNNIRQSISAFVSNPGGDSTLFMPGEFLATNFVFTQALDNVHPVSNPSSLVANGGLIQSLQDYFRVNSVYTSAAYQSFNRSGIGRVPPRTTGTVYSDQVANGANYINQNGVAVSYNGNLTLRNKIAFDFNGDGQRTPADINDMLRAYRQRNGGPAWSAPTGSGATQANGGINGAPGSDAVIEILGDANGDGNFNAADVRYAADGLFLYSGTYGVAAGQDGVQSFSGLHVDRKQAFTDVDTNWLSLTGSNNFFGTTLATAGAGATYTAGGSRADIAGSAGTTPGFAPVGNDGVVNAKDIDYVLRMFNASRDPAAPDQPGNHVPAGGANFTDIAQAFYLDLSADMNGDLLINQTDVNEILSVLQTVNLDFNFDRSYDQSDRDIIVANAGATTGGWAVGDANGDNVVNVYDNTICPVDFNMDGSVNPDDIGDFITAYFTFPPIAGPSGYAFPCPGNAPPYDKGYAAGFALDGQPVCGEPNPDNLGDYITAYFTSESCGY